MSTEQVGDIWDRVDLEQVRAARSEAQDAYIDAAFAGDEAGCLRLAQLILVSIDWEQEVVRQRSLPVEQRDHGAESVWERVSR